MRVGNTAGKLHWIAETIISVKIRMVGCISISGHSTGRSDLLLTRGLICATFVNKYFVIIPVNEGICLIFNDIFETTLDTVPAFQLPA